MKVTFLLLLLLLFNYCSAAEIFKLEIKKISAPNLLKNPEFKSTGQKKVPDGWVFANYSKKSGFSLALQNGIFYLKSPGGLYGYLAQHHVAVEEGKKYYAEVKLKLNSRSLLWITTSQYDDKLPRGKSSTANFSIANPEQGEDLIEELELFIDPDYILYYNSKTWNTCKLEFTVPKGHGVTEYDFKIGAYGGSAGFIDIKDPVFSLSRQKIELNLTGKSLKKVNIITAGGKIEHTFNLNPHKNINLVNFISNSRCTQYFAEIIDNSGKSYRRAL